ncbi:MAG: flagellar filament capping protein FliD [Candidatus Adiutrix sp.]|jgi:flagellar hook-associated protein 2|nr:flagellar filament capping protein FliD [Candidatus Adiutrix sp.]
MAVSTISGGIRWTGLASDTDFGKVVEQLVAIERRAITRQETWKSEWLKKLTAITGLDTRLSALKIDANSFDTRDKLLSRSAVSSNDKVVTLTNLSTAPAGSYEVEVGENIREKVASASFRADQPIGLIPSKVNMDAEGALLYANGEPALLPGLTQGVDYDALDPVTGYPLDTNGDVMPELLCYINGAGHLINKNDQLVFKDSFDPADPPSYPDCVGRETETGYGYPIDIDGNILYDALEPVPQGAGPQPFTITMGGKTLELKYAAGVSFDPDDPDTFGYYNGNYSMEQLAAAINAVVAEDGYTGPNISADIIFDKTRDGQAYSRLVITGGEGGSANHITISDPTNLGLDQKRFDEPVTTSLVGTTAVPKIAEGSVYTGTSNKTITFVPTTTGVLGEKDITISWADTLGNRGSFTIKATDWDHTANDGQGGLKNPVKVLQGLELDFTLGTNFIANEAFTIDCQVPVIQQAADSGMAASDKWIHQGWPDQTSPVTSGGAGRFDFRYAGENYSVTIGDGLGLAGLAEAINNFSQNPGVIASVINDGMGTATSYKLVLTGAHTGTEHGIEILSTTFLSRMDCSPDKFEHARYASNSMTRFDGHPNDGGSWLQRPTNEVSDTIEGTVVNLIGVGKATITIQNNVSDMANKIKSLVESVNLTKNFIKQNTKWGGGKLVSNLLSNGTVERATEGGEENGVMIGNYGFQISLSELDRLMTRSIFTVDEFIEARFPDASERSRLTRAEKHELYDQYLEDNGLIYTRLSDIGIRSDQSQGGVYVVEESKLIECLSRNPEAVIKLFTFTNGDSDFPVGNTVLVHEDEADRPRLSGFAVQLGFRMSDLTRANDVIDPQTGNVYKSAKGITKVLAENYNTIISGSNGNGGIDAKIAREERRIEMYKARLEKKFSRLETALSQLNSLSERVASHMAQLNNNNN